ncbi:hypothetical protein HDU76_013497, partial [Blyttiomyces sp. JEL0837]
VLNSGPSLFAQPPTGKPAHVVYQGQNLLIAEFRRYTTPSAGDTLHQTIAVNQSSTYIWAFNLNPKATPSENWKIWHGTQNRGDYVINWASGENAFTNASSLTPKYTHGMGMGITWLILFPFAVYWARFGKSFPRANRGWMWVHIIINVSGSILTVAFITYIVLSLPSINFGSSPYFNLSNRPHPITGYILVCLMGIQGFLGLLNRLSLLLESLHRHRRTIKTAHHTLGALLIPLGLCQAGMGLWTLYPFPDTRPEYYNRGFHWWVIYGIVILSWGAAFLLTEWYFSWSVRNKDVGFRSKSGGWMKSQGKAKVGFSVVGSSYPDDKKTPAFTAMTMASSNNAVKAPEKNPLMALNPPPGIQEAGGLRHFTWEDVNNELNNGNLYVVAKGRYVYDINQWLYSHPGGSIVLHQVAGTDITNDYFHESGFDAAAFVPKSSVPNATNRRLPNAPNRPDAATKPSANSANPTSPTTNNALVPRSAPQDTRNIVNSYALFPSLSELEWKLVLKARRTNVHSRLAIEKLSSLMVGEIVGNQIRNDGYDFEDDISPFSPFEYRRYALVESCLASGVNTATPIYRQKFCILYPQDTRRNEPTVFYPGQCIEIQCKVGNNRYVSRYFTPTNGSLMCFEINVKLEKKGALTPYLVRQKPGDRQIKIRGPFGIPLMQPERVIPGYPTWAYQKIVMVVGGSGLAAGLQLLEWLFMPKLVPLYVIQTYQAQNPDELTLYEGEWVVVREHLYDGWALGSNLQTGAEGLFPLPITLPRSGMATQVAIISSMHTADDAFGARMIQGALLAYPSYVSVTHVLTRGVGSIENQSPPSPGGNSNYVDPVVRLREVCPGDVTVQGRIGFDVLSGALNRVYWQFGLPGLRKVFLCGPKALEGVVYEMLVENMGVDHSEIHILPESPAALF